MQFKIYQVDAFTSQLFGGNPAAVCPLKEWLSDKLMQTIALENNLSETAFFIPVSEGKYHIRWFTPAVEVDLCGHATLATGHVLFNHLGEKNDTITFQSRSGALSITRNKDLLTLNFPTDKLIKIDPPEVINKGIGRTALETYVGREDYLVVLDNEALIADLNPDFNAFRQIESRGVIVTAPGNEVDFVSRCFFPNAGIDEDPVTGSAHTTLTPYWANRLGKNELTARQISSRGGALNCKLIEDRVAISGQAVTYMEGQIFL